MRIIKLHEVKPDGMPGAEIRINGDDIRSYKRDSGVLDGYDERGPMNVYGTRVTWKNGTSSFFAESPEEIDEGLFGGFIRPAKRPRLEDDIKLEIAAHIAAGLNDPNMNGQDVSRIALDTAETLLRENGKRNAGRMADRV